MLYKKIFYLGFRVSVNPKNSLRMKQVLILVGTVFLFSMAAAQNRDHEPSAKHPFGSPNPEAPPQISDFAGMIGRSDCLSLRRNPDGSWQDSLKMIWEFKYILNGHAIQDLTFNEKGINATSIRQYNKDSANWVVSYNATGFVSNTPGVWLGNREGDKVVLKQNQKAPNGAEGFSRLTFFNIREEGFDWKGEWVDKAETITYPFWYIWCRKAR